VLLPRGAVSRASLYLFLRAEFAALCTALPLLLFHKQSLWQSVPVFILVFLAITSALGLVLPADIRFAVGYLKKRFARQAISPAG
jgi:hypothetical protein